MKKLLLLFAFLSPLGVQAKCPAYASYEATRDFKMRVAVANPKKETIAIKEGTILYSCLESEFSTRFYIDHTRYETSNEEFDSHAKNGDLKDTSFVTSNDDDPVNPEPEPDPVQGPIFP